MTDTDMEFVAEPGETVYVRREMPWSEVVNLGRRGVDAYILDLPTHEDFDRESDPTVIVFVPMPETGIGKPLDIWSGALWLGAALGALVEQAQAGDETARVWVDRVPDEVKARWPGVFPEFPYAGEPADDHAERLAHSRTS